MMQTLTVAIHLTPRERDFLFWVAKGFSTKEIARHMKVSPETIKSHRKAVLEKTDSSNMVEAALKILK